MELSAICQLSESQGYSERARRLIKNVKHSKGIKDYEGKAPYEFYELWARYNIGVAYFHQREYRKAVLEFNWIIWQVKTWEEWKDDKRESSSDKKAQAEKYLKTFDDNKGVELLLLPAKLYRAQVQLKLQLAYHSLDTLSRHENEHEGETYKGWLSRSKQIKAELIKTGAYQLLGRLDRSRAALQDISSWLVGKSNNKVTPNDRLAFEFPGAGFSKKYPRLGERFLGILIEDHLQWLLLEGEDDKHHQAPSISYLTKTKTQKNWEIYVNGVGEVFIKSSGGKDTTYAKRLETAFNEYWKMIQHHADNRRGYFQQVAKYLGWLAEAADLKINGDMDDHKDKVEEARKKIAEVARGLYELKLDDKKELCDAILDEEPGLDDRDIKVERVNSTDSNEQKKNNCTYCDAKGIDLRRIEGEHYTWFTEAILKFFDCENISLCEEQNKQRFIKRLLRIERKERDNLRINNLKLHYDYYKPKELLDNVLKTTSEKLCGGDTEKYEDTLESVKKYSLFPYKGPKIEDKDGNCDLVPVSDYEKIMEDWGNYFFRHLESPSFHEHDTKANQFYFVGLQRWNSSSPAKGYSIGGGYLLYHLGQVRQVDMGIAIDPGFDFVRNLFHSGFSLDDIDIVLISHAHLDHIRDFESIITLLHELKKRRKREKRIHVILSLGAYKRLEHIVEDPGYRYFIEPYIIDIDREIDDTYFENLGKYQKRNQPKSVSFEFKETSSGEPQPNRNGETKTNRQKERIRAILPEDKGRNDYCIKIKPTRAYHRDNTYSDSFGFLIELNDDSQKHQITFGYTGDTKWIYPDMPDLLENDSRKFEDIADQYKYCDALVVHLGSLIKENEDGTYSFNKYDQCDRNIDEKFRCERQVRDENHPYLVGMLRFLSRLYNYLSGMKRTNTTNNPLVLIGEFGEELKGRIRIDFITRLKKIYRDQLDFLPVDVSMTVHLCNKYSEIDKSRDNNCACTVQCVQCQKFLNIGDADFEMYGTDNALYCVCKTCRRSTPPDVLQTTLRKLYEVGYDINTKKEDDDR
jgi:ribonuclease BN (tRNA processing enzyme)